MFAARIAGPAYGRLGPDPRDLITGDSDSAPHTGRKRVNFIFDVGRSIYVMFMIFDSSNYNVNHRYPVACVYWQIN